MEANSEKELERDHAVSFSLYLMNKHKIKFIIIVFTIFF